MTPCPSPYVALHDSAGKLLGVFIGAALWERCQDDLLPVLDAAAAKADAAPPPPALPPEPLEDWEALLQYWDFAYPPAYDLVCGHCGASTDDWRADDPRKFRLTAASLGGLTSFQCRNCQARIIKRHFKKNVSVECRPFVDKA